MTEQPNESSEGFDSTDAPVIADYELFEVPPRWLFLKVKTSDGTVGWGEPVVEGRAKSVRTAVEELMDSYLLGENPARIEHHWQTMYRGGFYRGGPILMSAIAGIDQALWDIKGKHYGAPVHNLLGGAVRDRIRIYQWIGGDDPADVAEQAREKVDAGFTALKMNGTGELERIDSPAAVSAAADRMREVREEVGDAVDVGVDFHGRVSKPMAKRLVEVLEPHDPFFVEEPVLPEHLDDLGEIAKHTTISIATGERLFSRFDFKQLFEDGHVDLIQPDLSHAGGITEVKKIASMAEAYDVAMAPHCPLGPVALASCVQVDACSPNALIQEQSLDIHYNETSDVLDYLSDPSVFDYEDGFVEIPDGPGLGVEVDEAYVREQAEKDVDWHNPVWRHDDGSVAEW
ncbi:Mandelate racemase/muconate lactonizing protein (plasmid) [Haloterrigena turkmenica DSM 5511]|uniref:Mandelate racemase/muconate lactonizing protein n=1 Tax=Haloterrigena turkmenica (strain ATCC 51198 / DSM 5511 / JCM 9101 / NCIMB 13204 / VKM B-1734 / 4k) TaxID=543526 RepID=D2S241_HALTV|nr:galactonate dehydratase [Haloterrigena turkmenica]ADB63438.1 Mandelate racemase/muconate lactonizing protein [Haloterrigena turkmenica DSM 5511]